ncbi:PIN domain-containing protein [Tepidiforma thermophila]|uniref:PIN domain-containing protein n=1 Tax=Tepidiforma thermophila (strain KCTC 52669 / CGMCC 1.13589 / G233) TaxID=2761530 RepID=UPI00241D090B|nr:PIN domain-containing protein [Tepidiforma thermophila]
MRNDSRAAQFAPLLEGRVIVVSFQTVAELYRWAKERGFGKRRVRELEELLRRLVVVPSSNALCAEWAAIHAEARQRGLGISPQDAWIAATARLYDLPLLTNNRRDFEQVEGLTLLEPPRPAPPG